MTTAAPTKYVVLQAKDIGKYVWTPSLKKLEFFERWQQTATFTTELPHNTAKFATLIAATHFAGFMKKIAEYNLKSVR